MATVKIERELTPAEVEGIVVTAIEQGIGYWATVSDVSTEVRASYPDDYPLFVVRERGGDGGPKTVTPQVLADGVGRVLAGVTNAAAGATEHGAYWAGLPPAEWQFEPRQLADMQDLGAVDADEADWVVQLGLFGHLVFG